MNADAHAHAQSSRASALVGAHLRDARARQQLPTVTTKRRWPHVDVDEAQSVAEGMMPNG